MKKIKKEDVDWVVNACFGRHKNIEDIKEKLSIHEIARILLQTWEYGEAKPKEN